MSQVDTFASYEFKRPKQIETSSDSSTAIEPKATPTNQQSASENATLQPDLSSARQMLQHQQGLVESLTEQLASSQAHTAQLECDFAALQQRYTEQSYHLQETESACLDLRTRLHRQQRQTLQFKAALEQCLESSALQSHSRIGIEAGSAPVSPVREGTSLSNSEPAQPSPSLTKLNREFAITKACRVAPPALGPSCQDLPSVDRAAGPKSADAGNSGQEASSTLVRSDPDRPLLSHACKDSKIGSKPLELAEEAKPLRLPLVFKEQPIQPWSAPQSGIAARSVTQNQPTASQPAKTQPTRQVQSHIAKSSQPNPSQQAQPKTLATVELPSFPRYRY